VKSKITYAKAKYREAVGLNLTGEGPVLQRQEEICPLFLRLHTVLGGSLSANPLPPRQTGSKEQETISSDDSEEESSDLEAHDNTFDTASFADTDTGGHFDNVHPSKRRKAEGLTPAKLNVTIDRMQQFSDQQLNMYGQSKSELRAREQAVEQREHELAEKLLRMAEEANKRAEEARVQLRQELAADRAEFKKEMALERAEIKQEREDLKRDRT
ncbi:hypothetical protein BG006_004902, partial [Podila minutissima]